MKRKTRYLFPLILILTTLSFEVLAYPLVKTGYVKAKAGESLKVLLEDRIGVPKDLLYRQGYFKKIIEWNPTLSDPNSLYEGEKLYVEVPYRTRFRPKKVMISKSAVKKKRNTRQVSSVSYNQTAQKKNESKMQVNISKESIALEDESEKSKKKWGLSFFYAISFGQFRESIINTEVETTSNQQSPFTLGLAVFKKVSDNVSYSGSAYFSQIDGGVSETNESVSVPWEYGLTSYLEYNKRNWPIGVYTGIDYERFSSYNTAEVANGDPLATRQHTLTFATLGASKIFNLFSQRFLLKASYSFSLMSEQSRESNVSPDPFVGTKFIVYLNMKGENNWSYNAFYKQHNLEGATILNISRLGFGVGYSF